MDFTVEKNPAIKALWGAGIKAAEFVIWHGVTKLITSSIGQYAKSILVPPGIDVITGIIGTVRDAIQKYRSAALTSTTIGERELLHHKYYGTH